ncbi:MAG: hypothetical protein LCH56_03735 [Proteobacteria bacterium]|nr:hypothetical protein [Pseudomonadota bacterium]
MRHIYLALTASVLAGCGPASRLDYAQRALIQCMETGRDGGRCTQGVMESWSRLAGACGVRNNVKRVCDGEFERRYFCNVSTREEKTTNEKGNVTIKNVEKREGPGCGLEGARRYELRAAYMAECERHSDVPNTSPREGASCYCGDTYCSFAYPDVSNETAVRYFPELADK